jgi:hypothetical protein
VELVTSQRDALRTQLAGLSAEPNKPKRTKRSALPTRPGRLASRQILCRKMSR